MQRIPHATRKRETVGVSRRQRYAGDVQSGMKHRFALAIGLGAIVSACATIMGVEEPRLVDDLDGAASTNEGGSPIDGAEILDDGGCLGAGCPCTSDPDCRAPFVVCVDSRCAQCASTPTDTCPAGSYCNTESACAIGCRTNEECDTLTSGASPFCDIARHRCVACLSSADCSDGMACSPSGTCTNTCTGTDAGNCASTNQTCCGGFCVDTDADPLNCSACGLACSTTNGQPTCKGGACTWACDQGYTHCQQGNTGCETNTGSDPARCGSCSNDCSLTVQNATGILCSVGSCSFAACTPDFANCDGNRANGCECACGRIDQRCCPGKMCKGKDDRCGADDTCHRCLGKNAPCSAANDICCKGCGANGKCK